MYALAAELSVPILIHFQEVPHTPAEDTFATGFRDFEAMLNGYLKAHFIGHADAFWANISADYANETAYPGGKVKRGGITDKLLGDYPNLFADLSANSGNNALSRDPEFTEGFLRRHEDKLIFGSDCACTDGKGGGISQAGNPAASRLPGKCVARETLTLLRKTLAASAFRRVTWGTRTGSTESPLVSVRCGAAWPCDDRKLRRVSITESITPHYRRENVWLRQ